MNVLFYAAAAVAIVSTALAITRVNAVHALLYLIVSFFAVAVVFTVLGAPFIAALEVIIYAGAIMVLFLFVIMLLNLGPEGAARERSWLSGKGWIGPAVLAVALFAVLARAVAGGAPGAAGRAAVSPREVGVLLLGPYLIGIELAAMLLLAGLVGAFHIGRRDLERGGPP